MADHTPGPWEVYYAGTGPNRSIWVQQDGVRELILGTVRDGEWERDVADAHLIAAAPDLLAACKELLSMEEQRAESLDLHIGNWPAIKAARHAIAKAEGDNP